MLSLRNSDAVGSVRSERPYRVTQLVFAKLLDPLRLPLRINDGNPSSSLHGADPRQRSRVRVLSLCRPPLAERSTPDACAGVLRRHAQRPDRSARRGARSPRASSAYSILDEPRRKGKTRVWGQSLRTPFLVTEHLSPSGKISRLSDINHPRTGLAPIHRSHHDETTVLEAPALSA
jgi:hypothetical protein